MYTVGTMLFRYLKFPVSVYYLYSLVAVLINSIFIYFLLFFKNISPTRIASLGGSFHKNKESTITISLFDEHSESTVTTERLLSKADNKLLYIIGVYVGLEKAFKKSSLSSPFIYHLDENYYIFCNYLFVAAVINAQLNMKARFSNELVKSFYPIIINPSNSKRLKIIYDPRR